LAGEIEQASDRVSIVTEPSERYDDEVQAPTLLRNPRVLDSFEKLVLNYGRPRYGEVDPTPLVAVTFPLIFGIMFGDIGQGLLLALAGAFLLRRPVRKGIGGLGSLIFVCGIVAIVFGAVYGSVFGMEDVVPALWLRPMDSVLGILVFAVAVGAIVLNVGLLASVANAWLAHDWAELGFGAKGIAGIVLYWSLVGVAVSALVPAGALPVAPGTVLLLAAGAAFLIVFGDPILNLVTGRRPLVEGSLGTHLIKKALELFETLLSFFSNTLSYVRMGAFAVAHGGLSAVMFILAEATGPTRGLGYWIVVALGNLVIVGFEGLIVGIQTLRLEYYEFFSKFFKGGGTAYKPLRLFPQGDTDS
jgi:V/A-type H+-transporting ATPase subunit I